MSDQTSDPARIESELEETRARLGTHLDELTRRLSPGQLLDEGLAYVRHGQGAAFTRNLGAQVRDNPLPVALTGISLAWLAVASNMRGNTAPSSSSRALVRYEGDGAWETHRDAPDDMAARAHRAGAAISRAANEAEETFRGRVADAQAGVLGMKRQAQETAASYVERVQQALESARRSAQSGMEHLRDRASDWSDSASAGTDRARSVANDMWQRGRAGTSRAGDYALQAGDYASRTSGRLASALAGNPLLLSAIGMTAGALFAALLPQSETEEAYLGGAAGQAVAAAQRAAGDVVNRGAEVAKAAVSAGYDAAREQGLSPEGNGAEDSDRRMDQPREAGRDGGGGTARNGDGRDRAMGPATVQGPATPR